MYCIVQQYWFRCCCRLYQVIYTKYFAYDTSTGILRMMRSGYGLCYCCVYQYPDLPTWVSLELEVPTSNPKGDPHKPKLFAAAVAAEQQNGSLYFYSVPLRSVLEYSVLLLDRQKYPDFQENVRISNNRNNKLLSSVNNRKNKQFT